METRSITINAIGYFLLYRQTNVRGYVGALFVTDNDGVPREFKCTEAIKPSLIQLSLYGEKLEPHIAIKLCVVPLLQKIDCKPDILFVNELPFLAVREHIDIPALFIQRPNNVSDDIQPSIVLMPYSRYESDKNDELIQQTCRFDLLEPFDRIQHAVTLLGEKDERFR